MNNLKNSVRLYGIVGANPNIQKLPNGTNKMAKLSLATCEMVKTGTGNEKQEATTWHNLIAYGKQAETIEKYVLKGDRMMIEGKLINQQAKREGGGFVNETLIEINEFILSTK